MTRKIALLIILTCALAGCATVQMTPSENQTLDVLSDNDSKSRVVFLRSSFVGSAIGASIFDVTDGDLKFIGMLQNNTKIAYHTAPGKRLFMVVSEAADYMEAQLGSGRTYYSIITPRMGAWTARFSMWPIRSGNSDDYSMASEQFSRWISKTKYVVNNSKTLKWFVDNLESIKSKHKAYWPKWKNKSPGDLKRRTLQVEDGI